jgi:hypothetical protein
MDLVDQPVQRLTESWTVNGKRGWLGFAILPKAFCPSRRRRRRTPALFFSFRRGIKIMKKREKRTAHWSIMYSLQGAQKNIL